MAASFSSFLSDELIPD